MTGPQRAVTIAPLLYALNPSRYYDSDTANKLARSVDLCHDGIRGDCCDQARRMTQRTGRRIAWGAPRSPSKGTLPVEPEGERCPPPAGLLDPEPRPGRHEGLRGQHRRPDPRPQLAAPNPFHQA
ncbi:hypothetical protein E1292_19910 [Nonomuraea deserti]|uniref:Uncharacterized protein n=1 Tax=Nonomuraea deserti TaxID=1848322 RepID=A0A4R4VUQ9_9ACTN|nr:hypothetical protein [Nonomuraea deserti]TDD04060.1 hypothetical protein E1292_19910 [Nonomuraea deserti]